MEKGYVMNSKRERKISKLAMTFIFIYGDFIPERGG